MTQLINDKLKKCCVHCKTLLDKPCAWLILGNEYCATIMEVQQEIERLNNIIEKVQFDMAYLDSIGINQVKPKVIWDRIELLKEGDTECK